MIRMKSAIAYIFAMCAIAYILAGCAEVREIAHLDKPARAAPSK